MDGFVHDFYTVKPVLTSAGRWAGCWAVRQAVGQSGGRSSGRSGSRSGSRAGSRSGSRAGSCAGSRAGSRAGGRAGDRQKGRVLASFELAEGRLQKLVLVKGINMNVPEIYTNTSISIAVQKFIFRSKRFQF